MMFVTIFKQRIFARLPLPWSMEPPVKTLPEFATLILPAVRHSGRLTLLLGLGRLLTTCNFKLEIEINFYSVQIFLSFCSCRNPFHSSLSDPKTSPNFQEKPDLMISDFCP